MELNDNTIFGESEIPDCPSTSNGGYCIFTDKFAVLRPAATLLGKDLHITSAPELPMFKIKTAASWGAKTSMKRNIIKGF